MNVKDVSQITNVTVRTLHHYEQAGLLHPGRNPDNGYREYTSADLDILQQILFFKECGFSLAEIKVLLDSPDFDRHKAFSLQKKYLLHEQERIQRMLDTIEKSVQHLKGETAMSPQEKFIGFDFTRNPYEEEARQLWGDKAIDASKAHIQAMPTEAQHALSGRLDELYTAFAKLMDQRPDAPSVQDEIGNLYEFFNSSTGHHYSPEAFAGVGQLYVQDERFTQTIDHYGPGLSQFLATAMEIYAHNHQ